MLTAIITITFYIRSKIYALETKDVKNDLDILKIDKFKDLFNNYMEYIKEQIIKLTIHTNPSHIIEYTINSIKNFLIKPNNLFSVNECNSFVEFIYDLIVYISDKNCNIEQILNGIFDESLPDEFFISQSTIDIGNQYIDNLDIVPTIKTFIPKIIIENNDTLNMLYFIQTKEKQELRNQGIIQFDDKNDIILIKNNVLKSI